MDGCQRLPVKGVLNRNAQDTTLLRGDLAKIERFRRVHLNQVSGAERIASIVIRHSELEMTAFQTFKDGLLRFAVTQ